MKYKAIGFDYGGVIIGKPGSTFFSDISNILKIDPITIKNVYFVNNYLINIEHINYIDFWKRLLIELKRTDKEKEFFDFLEKQPKEEINQGLIDLIKILRKKGYKIGLLSNNSTKVNIEIKNYGIDKFFDIILISADVGYMKPDPKIFEIFCEKLDIKSEELVFIDDTEVSLSTSGEIGYTPILFKNVENLKEKLIELNIL